MIVDRLTKSAYFILIKSTYSAEDSAKISINEIVSLHGTYLYIISYRGAQFKPSFSRSFQKKLDTQVTLCTAFHPQKDGKAEHTIRTLEDMLRASLINLKVNLDDHVSLIEFSYNSYYYSISKEPFEALYGKAISLLFGHSEFVYLYYLAQTLSMKLWRKLMYEG